MINELTSVKYSVGGGDIYFSPEGFLGQLKRIESGSVDCAVTDPAYWTLDKHRSIGTTTRLGGHRDADKRSGWFGTINEDDMIVLIDEIYRVLKQDSHCWMMCDGQTLPYITGYAIHGQGHGFKYFKPYPVLKRASNGGYKQGMGYHGRCSHEYVVLLEKGRRRFSDENWPDVFEAVWNGGAETKCFTPDGKPYPTAKPLSLFKRWIELSTSPGDVVIDPFLGSGTTAMACIESGRRFIGIDNMRYAVDTSIARIKHSQENPVLVL